MLRVSLRAVLSSNSAVAPGVAPFVASVVLTFTQHVNGTTVKAIEDTRNETDAGGELRNSHKEKVRRTHVSMYELGGEGARLHGR